MSQYFVFQSSLYFYSISFFKMFKQLNPLNRNPRSGIRDGRSETQLRDSIYQRYIKIYVQNLISYRYNSIHLRFIIVTNIIQLNLLTF